jgi:hypothetical protein
MHEPRLLHAIRLQAAWEPPAGSDAPWIRRFGRPAGVEPGQQVWLVVVGAQVHAATVLNGAALPPIEAGQPRWAHDITPLLRDRNVLEMLIHPGGARCTAVADASRQPAPSACGCVGLEIVAGHERRDAAAPHRA